MNSPKALSFLVSKKLTESFNFIKHDLRILLLSKFIFMTDPFKPSTRAMLPSKLSGGSFEYAGGIILISKQELVIKNLDTF